MNDCWCIKSEVICWNCFRQGFGLPIIDLSKSKKNNNRMRPRVPGNPIIYNSHIMKPNLKFGKLITIEKIDYIKNGRTMWLCLCDCGREARISRMDLINGARKECRDCMFNTKIKDVFQSNYIVPVKEVNQQ